MRRISQHQVKIPNETRLRFLKLHSGRREERRDGIPRPLGTRNETAISSLAWEGLQRAGDEFREEVQETTLRNLLLSNKED